MRCNHSIASQQPSTSHGASLWAQVVPALLQALRTMLALRAQRARLPNQLAAMLDRGLLKLAKSVTQIQETHPWCAARGSAMNGYHTLCPVPLHSCALMSA